MDKEKRNRVSIPVVLGGTVSIAKTLTNPAAIEGLAGGWPVIREVIEVVVLAGGTFGIAYGLVCLFEWANARKPKGRLKELAPQIRALADVMARAIDKGLAKIPQESANKLYEILERLENDCGINIKHMPLEDPQSWNDCLMDVASLAWMGDIEGVEKSLEMQYLLS